MIRNYIGLSCSGHDNAVAIVDAAGKVVFAEAAERHLQDKRALNAAPDQMFHIAELIDEYCDPDAELVLCKTWSDAADDLIARSRASVDESTKLLEARSAGASERTRRAVEFALARQRSYSHIADMFLDVKARAGRNLRYQYPNRKFVDRSYEHHLSHAAAACYTSPFSEAACVVLDGMGEGVTASCYRYQNGSLEPLEQALSRSEAAQLTGLGLFYADLCTLCGFDHWQGEEWKVMGLAAYGADDALLRGLLGQFVELDGLRFRRPPGEFAALAKLLELAEREPRTRVADLALAGQRVFEQLVIQLCRRCRELVPSANLVLCGGCALNSSANGKLVQATGFDALFVPCAPADDGNAVGAALLAYYEDHPGRAPAPGCQSPYLGSPIDRETLERAASNCGFKRVERLEPAALCEAVAERLCAGELVAWVQGRAEFGPRALGNRSILADPRQPDMKDRLNRAVKFREMFRPFAPAVLSEYAADYFDAYQESPYMERTLVFREDVRGKVPAVVHADGTGRLQSVKAEWNPLFHRLLSAFHRKSGVPVLVNTSFNVMGKPIVHSVEDAIAVFATSGLDVLAIENCLFAKR